MKGACSFILSVLLCSCVSDEVCRNGGDVVLSLGCVVDGDGVKSSFTGREDTLSDWQVFVFDSKGELAGTLYSADGDKLVLERGKDYHFYAMGNVGRQNVPSKEDELCGFTYSIAGLDALNGSGLPMSSCPGRYVRFNSGSASLVIPLKRVVAKYNLRIDKSSLVNSSFELESVSVMQSPLDVEMFGTESRAKTVGSCDSSSQADVKALNGGNTASFYLLENCRGVLLPGNDDQWKKVPENIPSESGRCTYLEIRGKWRTVGAESDIVCRLYLGRDNCSDFNIDRNTVNDVCLVLSDGGMLQSCWKVSRSNISDSRKLAFSPSEVDITPGNTYTSVDIVENPEGQKYTVTANDMLLEEASVDYYVEGSRLFVRSLYSGSGLPYAMFYLKTWDGIPEGSLKVNVVKPSNRIDGLEDSYIISKGSWKWPSLKFSPDVPLEKDIDLKISDASVLYVDWDDEDDECPLGIKAVSSGFAWIDVSFGTFSKRVYVYVPPEYSLEGTPSPYMVVDAGGRKSCTITSVPDNSIVGNVSVSSSDAGTVSVSSFTPLTIENFEYGGIGFGPMGKGCSFYVNGLKDGFAEITLTTPYPYQKKVFGVYVLGVGTILTVRCSMTDGRGLQIFSGADEIRLGTENSHQMQVRFESDATITSIELASISKIGYHPGRDTEDFYSVKSDDVQYAIGDSCTDLDLITDGQVWYVNGQDCYLYFNVTIGSNALKVPVRIKFASDYVAGDD